MIERGKHPTYKRQCFLLDFIRQLDTSVSATDLQKLVFLYTMRSNSDVYAFVPYKFGPYSFQLAEDIEILRRDAYLSEETPRIKARDRYPVTFGLDIDRERGDSLIKKAYTEYPYYAINSEIIDRLFVGAQATALAHGRDAFRRAESMLFTIGYEGRSVESFVNVLIRNDVQLLCDVRKNPLSRKFGFSKSKLKHIVETVGIHYLHIPELGIATEKRCSLNTVQDYQALFCDYAKTLPSLQPYIAALYERWSSGMRMALMCFEKEPTMCHRHVIGEHMSECYAIRRVDL